MGSTTKVQGLTIVASVAFHAALTGGLSWVAFHSFTPDSGEASVVAAEPSAPAVTAISIELPLVGEGFLVEERPVDPTGEVPRITGGGVVTRLDTGAPGHGGDATVRAPALNLADGDERMRLSPDLLNRRDRDQLQRLRVARVRQSWEDRRSTTNPAELTLVVTGPGSVRERRPMSSSNPSRGALESPFAGVRGGEIGSTPPGGEGEGERRPGGAQLGSTAGAPGAGLVDGRAGEDHRTSASIATARPDVTQGPVAVPANERARPKDDVDTDQEVATTVRSLVHASTAGGQPGEGQGGTGGGGEAGAGAAYGAGSRTRPLGGGEGDVFDFGMSDPRFVAYYRQIHRKIHPLWANAFPKSALLELKQGTVILEVTVFADGRVAVSWPPSRPSGIEEFDRNCADAIRRAAPLPPIPPEFAVRTLHIRMPFTANNPVIK